MPQSTLSSRSPRQRGKSSTVDILGAPPKTNPKWSEQHRRLTELRAQLLHDRRARSENAQDELSTYGEHMADVATDSYDRDCALALPSSTQEALYEIDEALHRITNGTYGICQLSGKPIELSRLKAIPWVRFSKAAQMQLEEHGVTNRAHLGELRTCTAAAPGTSAEEDDEDEPTDRPKREHRDS